MDDTSSVGILERSEETTHVDANVRRVEVFVEKLRGHRD